jgi:serine/threonine protein kinase
MREVIINSRIRENDNNHLIEFHGFYINLDDLDENNFKIHLVFERIVPFSRFTNNAKELLKNNTILFLKFICQVVWGVEELHSIGILHRDIKPWNIGINRDGIVKLFDFESSFDKTVKLKYDQVPIRDLKFKNTTFNKDPTTETGSKMFSSPEMILKGGNINESTDIWSLAVTIYHIYYGCYFGDIDEEETKKFIESIETSINDYKNTEMFKRSEIIVKKIILNNTKMNSDDRETISEINDFLERHFISKLNDHKESVYRGVRNFYIDMVKEIKTYNKIFKI